MEARSRRLFGFMTCLLVILFACVAYWSLWARPWPQAQAALMRSIEAFYQTPSATGVSLDALVQDDAWDAVAILEPYASARTARERIGPYAGRAPRQETMDGWLLVFLRDGRPKGYVRLPSTIRLQPGSWTRADARFELIPSRAQAPPELVHVEALSAFLARPRPPLEPVVFLEGVTDVQGFPYVRVRHGQRAIGEMAYHAAYLDGKCSVLEAMTESCPAVQEVYVRTLRTPSELIPVTPSAEVEMVEGDGVHIVSHVEAPWSVLHSELAVSPERFSNRPFHMRRVHGKIVALNEIFVPVHEQKYAPVE